MTPLKQLFRQPVRLFAIFLLVGMASAFICLSPGVFASAKATLAQIEERYVTIGVPTTETADVATEYNGLTLHHEESVISQDMWAYMDQLAADGTVIKGAYQQKYISAYCPSIQSVTSGKEDGTYAPSLDSPYNRAIMIVRVTSVDKTNLPESTELASVSVTASIENVVIAFARFLIPRSACTDALIDVESRLSSAPVPGAAQSSKIFFRAPSSRQRQKQLYTV